MSLAAESVCFAYGSRQVLDGVSLTVAPGRLLGLVGPNGAGKSTLLGCLAGARRPTAGCVTLDGVDLRRLPAAARARRLGVVPQSLVPVFPVSVAHYVGLGRYVHEPWFGGPREADALAVEAALTQVGVAHLAERPVDALSGGEWRRVLIAQALAQQPDLLLLDEPVQQLDLLHQLQVMELVRAFAQRPGAGAVVVLHDLSLAARSCDTLVLLHQGRILAAGPPDAVLTPDLLRTAYEVEAAVVRPPPSGALHVVVLGPVRSQAP